jgi:anti-sigma B factor antagonist
VTIESRQVGQWVVLGVAGRMDAENAPLFETQCESWISGGINHLLVDAADLVYISSMGLRAVVAIGKRLQEKGGQLRICRQTGLVKQVFEITRLNDIFPPHESVEAALADA